MADIPAVTQPVVEVQSVAPVIPGVQTSPPNEVIVPPVQNIAPAASQAPPPPMPVIIVEAPKTAAQLTIDKQPTISAVDAAYGRK
jgi:hypothetical protein